MDKLIENFAALGIAYNCQKPNFYADPEQSLIDSIGIMSRDHKTLKLVICWLQNYEDFIHLERLKALIKVAPTTTKAWLGGIAQSMYARRWASIIRELDGVVLKNTEPNEFLELQVKRLGADPNFKNFGIHIPLLDLTGIEKKLLTREHVLKRHFWLRLRALFGANWRADIAWQMHLDPNQTPYQVAKILGCNTETAYRNWKALQQANAVEFFMLPKNSA